MVALVFSSYYYRFMNILYGVQTTGHGHFIRSSTMIKKLKERGHNVFTLLSGPKLKEGWDLSVFEPYSFHKGLTFISQKGKIKIAKTAKQLDFIKFYKDVISYKDFEHIDLVITDYEPITARIAKLRKIPSIGIGHMFAFSYKVPVATFNPFAYIIMRWFAPVDYPIGLHWYHYGHPILPPTIPEDVKPAGDVQEDKILVYLGFEDVEEIKACLAPLKSHHFYVYSRLDQPVDEGHIHIRPFSREGFQKDLRECSGVIANAGFSLASEALHLGKKLLLKPLKGQIEQSCNALALLRLELGSVMDKLDTKAIEEWLTFPSIAPMNYSNVVEPFLDWVEGGNWKNTDDLVRNTWAGSRNALEQNKNFVAKDFSKHMRIYYMKYLRGRTPTRWKG